jgi:hypothetical protein
MTRYHPISLAFMACVLLPLALLTGSSQRDPITDQLDTMADSTGLTRVSHRIYRDWLSEGAHQLVSFDLEGGVQYHLLGACDVDCAELYFELLRPDGTRLARGTGSGNRPILVAEATQTGRYQLKASMRRCSIQPCEWGVRVYRR